eukprot:scaffold1265_cov173-Ochromonas_danica.AAC.11
MASWRQVDDIEEDESTRRSDPNDPIFLRKMSRRRRNQPREGDSEDEEELEEESEESSQSEIDEDSEAEAEHNIGEIHLSTPASTTDTLPPPTSQDPQIERNTHYREDSPSLEAVQGRQGRNRNKNKKTTQTHGSSASSVTSTGGEGYTRKTSSSSISQEDLSHEKTSDKDKIHSANKIPAQPLREEKKKDPALVPRRGQFFLHDDRGRGSNNNNINNSNNNNNNSNNRRDFPNNRRNRESRNPSSQQSGGFDDMEWKHDKFEELMREQDDQQDTRGGDRRPHGGRQKQRGRGPPAALSPGPVGPSSQMVKGSGGKERKPRVTQTAINSGTTSSAPIPPSHAQSNSTEPFNLRPPQPAAVMNVSEPMMMIRPPPGLPPLNPSAREFQPSASPPLTAQTPGLYPIMDPLSAVEEDVHDRELGGQVSPIPESAVYDSYAVSGPNLGMFDGTGMAYAVYDPQSTMAWYSPGTEPVFLPDQVYYSVPPTMLSMQQQQPPHQQPYHVGGGGRWGRGGRGRGGRNGRGPPVNPLMPDYPTPFNQADVAGTS